MYYFYKLHKEQNRIIKVGTYFI